MFGMLGVIAFRMFLFLCGGFELGKSGNPPSLLFTAQHTSLGEEWLDELRPENGTALHGDFGCSWYPGFPLNPIGHPLGWGIFFATVEKLLPYCWDDPTEYCHLLC